MSDDRAAAPSPLQTLILWALLARGGTALQKDLRPEPKKSDRDALVRARLLRAGKAGRAVSLELTDAGWAWAAANTAAPLPAGSTAGTAVLSGLLGRLGAYMAARDVALADIIHPPVEAPGDADLAGRIRAAYLAESGGSVNRRVRLAALRARLAEVPRAELDTALLALAQDGGAGLLPLDDPTEIGAADHAAAIAVGTQMRHILWLDR
ncbi:conserved protein of unknown function [Rhodovastum atsumiense]|uniref:MarR family transcriptional regulator n=1 Tax=Rhodovastum atsumiense TaxID=504468 RepID=UPI00139F2A1D|nr:MarR family transcriptional regulator [Rhodovastum atsumiense]CAH2601345.1 conserved protein of unknown function [Rhodovastum atsumiense]